MRGDFVTISVQGDFGKPRPALVIQADHFSNHGSLTVLPVTSTLVDAPLLRITIDPDSVNGLQKTSQIMVDKVITIKKDKIEKAFGKIDADHLIEIERCLAVFLGIVK